MAGYNERHLFLKLTFDTSRNIKLRSSDTIAHATAGTNHYSLPNTSNNSGTGSRNGTNTCARNYPPITCTVSDPNTNTHSNTSRNNSPDNAHSSCTRHRTRAYPQEYSGSKGVAIRRR